MNSTLRILVENSAIEMMKRYAETSNNKSFLPNPDVKSVAVVTVATKKRIPIRLT